MAVYDGSINISTKIDESGMNKGTKSISNSLGGVLRSVMKIAKILTAVFVGGTIINGIRSMIGQFDLMSSSIGGSLKQLSTAFDALKGTFVNLILTAIAPFIPYVITVVQWLTNLLTIITQIIGALFGVQTGFSGVASSAGSAGKEAKKSAQGALAAFDQINVLQKKEDNAGAGGGGGAVLPSIPPISPELLKSVEEFKAKMLKFLEPVIAALGRLKDALVPLGKTIWAGLKWAWDNILVPLGSWVISDVLPAFLDILAGAAKVLNAALEALGPVFSEFFKEDIVPLAQFAGGVIVDFLQWLIVQLDKLAKWIEENPAKFDTIIVIIGGLAAGIWLAVQAFSAAATIASILTGVIAVFGGTVVVSVAAVFSWIVVLGLLVAAIIYVIAHWQELSTTVQQLAFIVKYYIGIAADAIKNGFNSALDFVLGKFISTFVGIREFIRSVVNSILDIINGMIAAVVNGINTIVGGMNTVGSLAGGGVQIPTLKNKSIPKLATGAVIPPNAQFAAILGDQTSGRNLEAPESLIRQIVSEEVGKIQADIKIGFTGSLSSLVRELKPYIDKENVRVGGSLITSNGGVS